MKPLKRLMNNLTDQNFERELASSKKPVLVDFFADWCPPCSTLTPILEKISEDLGGRFILVKINVDDIPLTAQKFKVEKIPTVVLFKNGKPVSGFVGVRPESSIKEWLEKELGKETSDIGKITEEYEKYAKEKGFRLNPNRETVERVIRGLLENERKYGKRYCPCRRVSGEPEKDDKIVCPCSYHLKEIEEIGHCLCDLFQK